MQAGLLSNLGSSFQQLSSRLRPKAPAVRPQGRNVRHSSFDEILHPEANVVHIRRDVQLEALQDIVPHGYKAQTKAKVDEPQAAVDTLLLGLSSVQQDAQQQRALAFLRHDIARLCQDFAAVCPPEDGYVNVKLGSVENTSCPKWHADHVMLRLLATYYGPGTLYMPDDCVSRWTEDDGHPVVAVRERDEKHSFQAGPGDLLLLKGHSWPHNMGGGAVHKSPVLLNDCDCGEEHEQQRRLVLTIDTATDW